MTANLFTIPPGAAFLPTLVEALRTGRLVPGHAIGADPLALSDATIFVPTRRAARALAAHLAEGLGTGSALLPRIRPIGEGDDVDLFGEDAGADDLLPVMDGLARRLTLARLVRNWRSLTTRTNVEALVGGAVVPPASAADALWLAGELAALLDEAEAEGVDLDRLADLAPERLAEWWQLSRTFLSIVTEHWPAVLAAAGVVGPMEARNRRMVAEAERWRSGAVAGPVILAGSTATAPPVLDLMAAIAARPDGAVVLPGLDTRLDSASRTAIAPGISATAPGHPQHGLNRILARFDAAPGDVPRLDAGLSPGRTAREILLSEALRPAETTDHWFSGEPEDAAGSDLEAALEGLALVEADSPHEEALACVVAMRAALADPKATVALVTPDRDLARRAVAELERFGIEANDSAGRPLSTTAPGTLLSTALSVALEPGDPVPLIALLKHPLTRLGMEPGDARRAARTVEMIALRGSVDVADGVGLSGLFDRQRAALEAAPYRFALPVRHVAQADRDLGADLARRLERALAPLTDLRGGEAAELPTLATALTRVLEALATDPQGDASALYAEEPGRALATFLGDLVATPPTGFCPVPHELPDCMAALMADVTVRPRAGLSARVFVLGTLEARLQRFDMVVLGGLNEGTWPAGTNSGAFLSRLMRREIALEPPEQRIGLAAHDFWMAMGTSRVVMSRARRAEGAPTIAARWVQRLLTRAGPAGAERLRTAGEPFLAAAGTLDRPKSRQARAARPEPRPPLARRPRQISVTQVERLIRDPYAVHAEKVLRLERLPELVRDPHAAERGSLFHEALGRFVQQGHDPVAADAAQTLTAIARDAFAQAALPVDVEAVWWPRMETLIGEYLRWEAARDGDIAERHAEISGHLELAALATTLTGRADRIDRRTDGSLDVIDFKTGSTPSIPQARSLLAPQLALEGAMVRRGGFGAGLGDRAIRDLVFVRLRERRLDVEGLASEGGRGSEPVDAQALSDRAFEKLNGLLHHYRRETNGFRSRARPMLAGDFSGPYDHLARAHEWASGEDGGEGGTAGGDGA